MASIALNIGIIAFSQNNDEEIEITVFESRSDELETIEKDIECIAGGPGSIGCKLSL